ncbi:hypothetical protein PHLCEN_2v11704 [Hermanssonia centrifuga]|uniref:Uncharacterized protein n=1 Tax=Hermanssonia centrifuga TaxID=98765 RepID=A0A2R6NJ98_9APHY|nr:hypothetical protein PHLCEN_2v11704 [Hermanssonia centrifuga]
MSSGSKNAPVGSQTQRSTTRSSRLSLNTQPTRINSYVTGLEILRQHTLVPPGAATLEGLSSGLQHLADTVDSQIIKEKIIAFAYYAERVQIEASRDIIANVLLTKLSPIITLLETGSEHIEKGTDRIVDFVEKIESHQNENLEKTQNALSALESASKGLKDAPRYSSPPPDPNNHPQMSYANALRLPPQHATILTREETKSKQVLLEKVNITDQTMGKQLEDEVLLRKANLALEHMGIQANDAPKKCEEIYFASVMVLPRGGVVYEMDSRVSAEWIKKADVKAAFLEKYGRGLDVEMRERKYLVVVDLVPIRLNMEDGNALRRVEDGNGMKERGV